MYLINCDFCNNQFNCIENNFFCSQCGKLNALPNNINYFEYLHLPIDININITLLEEQYVKLLSIYHSDNFINKDQKQQLNSAIHSSFINNGYLTLKNELKTIGYFYKLISGIEIVEDKTTIKDNKFNLYIFELNEELDEIENEQHKAKYNNKINTLYDEIKQEINQYIASNNLEGIQESYIKLLYIKRIKEKL
ncbi:Fe-S protein assembly co-chaperone HscB [Rickettsiales bacterium LUAb2]